MFKLLSIFAIANLLLTTQCRHIKREATEIERDNQEEKKGIPEDLLRIDLLRGNPEEKEEGKSSDEWLDWDYEEFMRSYHEMSGHHMEGSEEVEDFDDDDYLDICELNHNLLIEQLLDFLWSWTALFWENTA